MIPRINEISRIDGTEAGGEVVTGRGVKPGEDPISVGANHCAVRAAACARLSVGADGDVAEDAGAGGAAGIAACSDLAASQLAEFRIEVPLRTSLPGKRRSPLSREVFCARSGVPRQFDLSARVVESVVI